MRHLVTLALACILPESSELLTLFYSEIGRYISREPFIKGWYTSPALSHRLVQVRLISIRRLHTCVHIVDPLPEGLRFLQRMTKDTLASFLVVHDLHILRGITNSSFIIFSGFRAIHSCRFSQCQIHLGSLKSTI